MSHSRKDDWKRIVRLFALASTKIFEEIRAPSTPILVPLLFLLVSSVLVLMLFVATSSFGYEPFTAFRLPDWFSEVSFGRQLLVYGFLTLTMLVMVSWAVIILGTYLYAIARYFRIDDIRWEYWVSFACWTLIPMFMVPSTRLFFDGYEKTQNPSFILSIVVLVLGFVLPIVWSATLTIRGLLVWTEDTKRSHVGFCILPYVILVLMSVPDVFDLFSQIFS